MTNLVASSARSLTLDLFADSLSGELAALPPPAALEQPLALERPEALWLAVWLPRFALESHFRAERGAPPMAALGGPGGRQVLACNVQATMAGVAPGSSLATASALCSGLRTVRRNDETEQHALEAIAGWSMQFTPAVSLRVTPGAVGLVMEVGASLALFGGLNTLRGKLRDGLRTLGYTPCVAIAPTPAAAWLLALARREQPVLRPSDLPGALASVPTRCLVQGLNGGTAQDARVAARTLSRLHALGVRSFADCRRLPRADLGRRLAIDLLSLMDRALGSASDLQAVFEPESHFTRRLDFIEPTDHLEQVSAGFGRLLDELCGFLAGREAGVFRFEVTLAHEQRGPSAGQAGGREASRLPATRLPMALLSPSRDTEHLGALLRERLERISLAHPVTHIALQTLEVVTLTPSTASLFEGASFMPPRALLHGRHLEVRDEAAPAAGVMTPALAALVERLRARLEQRGNEEAVVYRPGTQADHRPEKATQAAPLTADSGARAPTLPPVSARMPRPLWLLAAPEPLSLRPWRGAEHDESGALALFHRDVPLEVHGRPERLECGWWDGDDVGRDYFMATTPSGAQRWIFRARRSGRAYWYLHGLFG